MKRKIQTEKLLIIMMTVTLICLIMVQALHVKNKRTWQENEFEGKIIGQWEIFYQEGYITLEITSGDAIVMQNGDILDESKTFKLNVINGDVIEIDTHKSKETVRYKVLNISSSIKNIFSDSEYSIPSGTKKIIYIRI